MAAVHGKGRLRPLKRILTGLIEPGRISVKAGNSYETGVMERFDMLPLRTQPVLMIEDVRVGRSRPCG